MQGTGFDGGEQLKLVTMSGKEADAGGKSSDSGAGGKTSDAPSGGAGGKVRDADSSASSGPSQETLMERVMAYCRTRDFLKIFEDYILNHLKYFKDAELDESGDAEHRLDWWEIFQDYLKVFEGVMEEFIEREGGDFNAFYQECREKQDHGDPHEKHFLKLLLASADYKDFSRIMIREASFYYATGMSSFGRLPKEDEDRMRAEAEKESADVDDGYAGQQGGRK